MRKISKIEAVIPRDIEIKRVAAYARISLETEVLKNSLSAQISHYSSLIQNTPGWSYVGVYADEGISGTNTKKRDGFNRLIEDCEDGKIDIILTKSISRFARNTVDLLETVRRLKTLGIEVRFERENISTMSGDGELMLTILASFAQEESRSLSENITWSIKKGYERGKPHSFSRTFGYKWNGRKYEVIPEEAKYVQYMYEEYSKGVIPSQIEQEMKKEGVIGISGKPIKKGVIYEMLKNEIYTGALLFQKKYSPSVGVRTRNYGEKPKYLVEDAHEAIVSKELFEAVQRVRIERGRSAPKREYTCFTGKVRCGKCGYKCSRRNIVHSKKIKREYYKRWLCNGREKKGMSFCNVLPIDEDTFRMASAFILGDDILDEEKFKKKIKEVVFYDERLEYYFEDGRMVLWQRK